MVNRINSLFEGDDSLLGVEIETVLSTRVAADISAIQTDAWRLTGQPADSAVYDEIVIQIYDPSDDSVSEQLTLSIVDFIAIESAAQGDVLVAGTTGRRYSLSAGTILIGRTSGNRAMIQAETYNNAFANFTVTVTGRARRRGLLDRRISSTQDRSRRRRWLLAWHTSKPAPPEYARLIIDSALQVHRPGAAGDSYDWSAVHTAVKSHATKSRWASPVDVFWSPEISGWDVEVIGDVYPFDDVFDGGFADSQYGPYQLNYLDGWGDVWIRVRGADGAWMVDQALVESPISRPVNWRPQTIFHFDMASGASYKLASFNVDWSDRQRLTLTMEQFPETGALELANRERIQVASWDAVNIGAVEHGHQDSFQANSLWALLGETRSAWGHGPVDNSSLAAANMGIVRLNLMAEQSGAAGDQTANRYSVRRWNTSKQWRVTGRLY